jgi:hypothetical protein
MAKAKNSHWKQRVQGHPWQKHTELKTNSRERERERDYFQPPLKSG